MAKNTVTKPFGTKIVMCVEDIPLHGIYNGGVVIKRSVVRKPEENRAGMFEYSVRYGQGMEANLDGAIQ